MACYALGLVPRRPYRFRNGARLRIGRGVEHVPIIEIFLRHDYGVIAPGATVVDLGASTGVFAVYAAATSRAARIVAYEPMPGAYALLIENVALNGADVECRNAAIAAEGGEVELFVEGSGLFFPSLIRPAANAVSVKVPALTLSAIMERDGLESIDLLKIDIEGSEYDVLYSAPAERLARIAEIRMEAHHVDDERRNPAALARFLQEAGYTIMREQADPTGVVCLWAAR